MVVAALKDEGVFPSSLSFPAFCRVELVELVLGLGAGRLWGRVYRARDKGVVVSIYCSDRVMEGQAEP